MRKGREGRNTLFVLRSGRESRVLDDRDVLDLYEQTREDRVEPTAG
jgi:hypothetical protein